MKERSQVFGGKCTESLASYDQESLSWKTCQLSLFGGLMTYSDRFPKSGIMQNGVLYQLVNLALPTCENAGFVLPTPTRVQMQSQEMRERAISQAKQGKPLAERRIKDGKKVEGKRNFTIEDAVIYHMMLPTPTCNDAKNNFSISQLNRVDNLNKAIFQGRAGKVIIGKDSRLNPPFVEEMMGFPIGWTELKP